MRRLHVGFGLALAMLVGASFGTSWGLESSFALQVTQISNGPAGSRVLFDPSPISGLGEQLILSAYLTVPLSGSTPTMDVHLKASPLTTFWGTSATWTSPWSSPGGDVDGTLATSATLHSGDVATILELDVTDVVRSIVEGESGDYGMMLHPDDPTRMGFNSAEMAVLGSLQGGEIRVTYRSLTSYGLRGGAQQITARRRQAQADSRANVR